MPVEGAYIVRHGLAYLDTEAQVVAEPMRMTYDDAQAVADKHEFVIG